MTVTEILAELRARHVELEVRGDRLRFRPRSAVSQELREALRTHKAELMKLVDLRGWPAESRDAVRRFRTPGARLYPLLNRAVVTPLGQGRLLQVFAERVAVLLDQDSRRVTYLLPSEVRPPGVDRRGDGPLEDVH